MSDPAKTPAEIEDVLASIRRLVSDTSANGPEQRRRPASGGSAPVGEQPSEPRPDPANDAVTPNEALVLTPSFRVMDPEDPWAPVEAAKDEKPLHPTGPSEPEQSPRDDVDWNPDDRLVAFASIRADQDASAAETPATDAEGGDQSEQSGSESSLDLNDMSAEQVSADFEPETGDDNWPNTQANTALLSLVARREPAADITPQDDAEAHETDAKDTDESGTDDSALGHDDGSEDTIQQTALEALVAAAMGASGNDDAMSGSSLMERHGEDGAESQSREDYQGDPEPQSEDAGDPASGAQEHGDDHAAEDDAVDHEADEHGSGDDVADNHEEDAPVAEALEARDYGQTSDPEYAEPSDDAGAEDDPQGDHADDTHSDEDDGATQAEGEVEDHEAQVVETVEAAATDDVDDLGEEPSPFTFPDAGEGEDVLDEETLRAIIVDVVREELQGVLGQRITRNVRKMVRREVRLALAAEELD